MFFGFFLVFQGPFPVNPPLPIEKYVVISVTLDWFCLFWSLDNYMVCTLQCLSFSLNIIIMNFFGAVYTSGFFFWKFFFKYT